MDFLNSCRFCLKIIGNSDKIEINREIRCNFFNLTSTELKFSPNHFPNHCCKICLESLENYARMRVKFTETQNYLYSQCPFAETRDNFPDLLLQPKSEIFIDFVDIKLEEVEEDSCLLTNERYSIGSQNEIKDQTFPKSNETGDSVKNNRKEEERLPCHYCNKLYKRSTLNGHIKSIHLKKVNYICDVCGKAFFGKKSVREHLAKHFKIRSNPCHICRKLFSRLSTLKLHMKNSHGTEKVCKDCVEDQKFCGKHLVKVEVIKKEQEVNYISKSTKIPCKTCGALINKGGMLAHIRAVHHKVKNYQCDLCSMGFFYKEGIKNHLKKHFKIRDSECPECGKKFARPSTVREHIKWVHRNIKKTQDPTFCELCGKSFSNITLYHNHVRAKHTGERKYACDFKNCNKRYFGSSDLLSHKESHAEPKECDICHELVRHMKSHKRQKHTEHKHICQYEEDGVECGRTFPINSLLNYHVKTAHWGIKKILNCNECGIEYKTSQALSHHRRNVHEKTKIQCELCSTLVTRKDYYKRHINLHHKELDEVTKKLLLDKIKKTPVKDLFVPV